MCLEGLHSFFSRHNLSTWNKKQIFIYFLIFFIQYFLYLYIVSSVQLYIVQLPEKLLYALSMVTESNCVYVCVCGCAALTLRVRGREGGCGFSFAVSFCLFVVLGRFPGFVLWHSIVLFCPSPGTMFVTWVVMLEGRNLAFTCSLLKRHFCLLRHEPF